MTTESIIPQGGRLAELLGQGYTITYAEDTVTGDGWFADLRDQLGRVIESGGGHTQAAALEHLAERVERDGSPAALAAAATTAPGGSELEKLLDAGYEVTLSRTAGKYEAHVNHMGGSWTAVEATPELAVWAASPLHGDDEPFPGEDDLCITEVVDELHDEMDVITERVADLEDRKREQTLLIRMLGDLFTRAFPDGLVATRGDVPGMSSDAEVEAIAGGLCEAVDARGTKD